MISLLDTRRVFVFILALGIFAMAARNVTDPDVWWHLRTGELIVHNHAVFHADPYSFTKFGRPWVNHEWLSDILIFTIYRTMGWPGLIAIFAAITSATFMLVFLVCADGPYWAAAFTVWAAIASAPAWGVRPQAISLLLASLFLVLLERSYLRPKILWWTVPLMLIWVNLHGGYALGIALVALFLAGDLLDITFGFEKWPQLRNRIRNLGFAIAACVAVVPVNPYGARIYWYPLQTIHSRAMESYISEWLSPNFHQAMYAPLLLLILGILVAAAISPVRLRPRDLLLLSATAWAALHSARHVPIFALVAAPILSKLAYGWRREKRARSSLDTDSVRPGKGQTIGLRVFNGLVLAAFLTFTVMKIRHVFSAQDYAESRAFPAAAVSFLSANRLPQPLFSAYNWGGYLIWKLYPNYRVYVDGRADLYGDGFLDQFAATYQITDAAWQHSLEGWHIHSVILPPDAPLISALRLRSGWKQVYGDVEAVILVNNGAE